MRIIENEEQWEQIKNGPAFYRRPFGKILKEDADTLVGGVFSISERVVGAYLGEGCWEGVLFSKAFLAELDKEQRHTLKHEREEIERYLANEQLS